MNQLNNPLSNPQSHFRKDSERYDRIFTTESDLSSNINDLSQKQDDSNLTYLLDQKHILNNIIQDSSFADQSLIGIFNSMSKSANNNIERINQGMHQLEHLFNKIADISDTYSYKTSRQYSQSNIFRQHLTATIGEDELKDELRDQVYDLPQKQDYYNPKLTQQTNNVYSSLQDINKVGNELQSPILSYSPKNQKYYTPPIIDEMDNSNSVSSSISSSQNSQLDIMKYNSEISRTYQQPHNENQDYQVRYDDTSVIEYQTKQNQNSITQNNDPFSIEYINQSALQKESSGKKQQQDQFSIDYIPSNKSKENSFNNNSNYIKSIKQEQKKENEPTEKLWLQIPEKSNNQLVQRVMSPDNFRNYGSNQNSFEESQKKQQKSVKQNEIYQTTDGIFKHSSTSNIFDIEEQTPKPFLRKNSAQTYYSQTIEPKSDPQIKNQTLKQSDFYGSNTPTIPKYPKSNISQNNRNSASNQKKLFEMAEKNVIKKQKPCWKKKEPSQEVKRLRSQTNQISQQQINDQDLHTFCVNCEQFIKFEEVDKHSKECIVETPKINKTQLTSTIIQEINRKLNSIKESLMKQAINLKDNINEIDLLDQIISNNRNQEEYYQSLRKLQKLFNEYEQQHLSQKFYVIMLLQRAIFLCEEKGLKLQYFQNDEGDNNDSVLYSELSIVEKMALQEKANLELWKQQHEMMMMVQAQDLQNMRYLKAHYLEQPIKDQEILSQISSALERGTNTQENKSVFQGTNSLMSDLHYQNNIDQVYTGRNIKEAGNAPDQDAKRVFYNLAVCAKLNLPHNHPAKNILIQDIYEEAMQQKVPQQYWEQFIEEAIKNM